MTSSENEQIEKTANDIQEILDGLPLWIAESALDHAKREIRYRAIFRYSAPAQQLPQLDYCKNDCKEPQ